MELDKRIMGKRPLDCVDSETAKEFIGEKGYFANCIQAFQDLESTDYQLVYATLKEVDSQRVIAFTDDFDGESSYFLPEEWVMPKKKWRAYTIAEFQETFTVGRAVRLRRKDTPTKEHLLAFGGYYTLHDGRVSILFGIHLYTLEELFEQYEWQEFYTDEYRPFGIEE